MPTAAAEHREDRVVALVVADLIQSGHPASVVDRPDRNRNRNDELTVDAELMIDGERWAMDVMTLRWRPNLEAAVKKLKARLEAAFSAQLATLGMTLVVTCHVSTDEEVVGSLVDLARKAVDSGQDQRREDESATLWPWSPGLGAVEVQPWLGQSANLRDEIVLSSGEPLGKKLQRQLAHARQLGFRTCLAIDQRGPLDLKFGASFMPLPGTIGSAVEQVESEAGASFDALVVVREDDTASWLRPVAP